MKISRRGKHTKHARRGRHTKRAGKHLRYKTKSKKFRASKRYHRGRGRGRVRTHKRGKRFHRGGEDFECNLTFKKDETGKQFYRQVLENQELYFKKNKTLVQGEPSQKFRITLSVDYVTSVFNRSLFYVNFMRTAKDGRNILHNITDLAYFGDNSKQRNTLNAITDDRYDFSDTRNETLFKAIQQCITDQLAKVLSEFKDLLENCRIRICSLLFKDLPKYDQLVEYGSGGLPLPIICAGMNEGEAKDIINGTSAIVRDNQDKSFLSFFDCIYSNNGTKDDDKTKILQSFIPFHYLRIFFKRINRVNITESSILMKQLRTILKQKISSIISQITVFETARQNSDYQNMTDAITQLRRLLKNNSDIYDIYDNFITTNGIPFTPKKKIDMAVADFVSKASSNKVDEDVPTDAVPPAAPVVAVTDAPDAPDAPNALAPVVAETADAQTRVFTTGEHSVRGPGDDDAILPQRVAITNTE
jgi:hypothetical protein